ncbi:hypothetical protein NDU88_007298 [Pleurodeles waltl]|uniref:Uncharacterized protein n=1 Tax=Pleurodeles waltl TaxID=8319 RepID=A0AAV7TZN8_PLEWA|nr:hypothetical protein NDU88_007298 [Pleurodeles waltl]
MAVAEFRGRGGVLAVFCTAEDLDPLEEQVAFLIETELAAGVEGQNNAEVEDQKNYGEQAKTSGDQLVCDALPVEDTILTPMDDDAFQQLLDSIDKCPLQMEMLLYLQMN